MTTFIFALLLVITSILHQCWAASNLRGAVSCPCFSLHMMIDHFQTSNHKLGSCTMTQEHEYHRRVLAHSNVSEENLQVYFFDVTPKHCGFQYSKDLNMSPKLTETEGHVDMSMAEFAACEAVFEAFIISSVCPDPPASVEVV